MSDIPDIKFIAPGLVRQIYACSRCGTQLKILPIWVLTSAGGVHGIQYHVPEGEGCGVCKGKVAEHICVTGIVDPAGSVDMHAMLEKVQKRDIQRAVTEAQMARKMQELEPGSES